MLGANPGIALLHLDQQDNLSAGLLAGLMRTFHRAFAQVFLYAAAISAVTTLGAFGLKEIPLRGS